MLQWIEAKGARRTMIAWLAMGLLMLAAAGCTRPDWIEQTLVTVDVTGVWRGTYGIEPFEVTLQQSGPKVTGQFVMRTGGQGRVDGPAEGTINGDTLRFHDSRGGCGRRSTSEWRRDDWKRLGGFLCWGRRSEDHPSSAVVGTANDQTLALHRCDALRLLTGLAIARP